MIAAYHMLRHYLTHPLGRRDRLGTVARILRWQLGSRVLGTAATVPFVDGTRLLVRAGMHGATGNIYVGLMEFEGMAFVAHFLREGDVFVDVGANVGVYSILAASRGARVLALEPVPASYERLLDNVHINRFQEFVDARNIGAGAEGGTLRFSTNEDSTNHVLADDESCKHAVVVEVAPLDEIVQEATMLKVDVEGYEAEVLKGAGELLSKESLRAVLVELNGLGA